ncbi:MAG: hypothetical protein COV07_01030 [Candidatus Vogelbacteria bacterium CG10_big_fil_rev_8_21_14_0_10_45_14]|uniref:PD-(D/E)XK endonuclease-like domain-containing protein n=1 Tax=Candidatus Vogelbacteria bacterium CG10_big_fil_rev_8_21_14_0_10_45_14 TaxID=1975042 RepID=A0A2H0RKP8_9BACT|nr:MAG: hypothetical protein COV07_01030 [Candidatus Vogelbacteria bacterium CG10_big_fil_rev_8_21_14_0_10_45_14]
MSEYYTGRRTTRLYDPNSPEPFYLSRSKLENFIKCKRCFYLDRRLGVSEPPGYPFSLNSAVDHLLKKEFDIYREKGEPHPLMVDAKIDAVPFVHPKLDEWRETRKGLRYVDEESGFLFAGAVDDLWINKKGEVIVVDYKATSKDTEVSLDADWQIGYKRQMEIYQWLVEKNDLKVSSEGYFVYANGRKSEPIFDAKLHFDIKVIPYKGDRSWVSQSLKDAAKCLKQDELPPKGEDCDYCLYREVSINALIEHKRQVSAVAH